MGIKSGFNNISQIYVGSTPVKEVYYGTNLVYSSDRGDLSLWRYSNDVIEGKTLLFNYIGSWDINTLYVPKAKGKAIINDWYNISSSGTTETNRNTPFCRNPNVVNVDLQGVPFRNNSMYNAFDGCYNLTSVNNILNSVTNMFHTFYSCERLNQNIQIPNSVTDMSTTFQFCYNLNQNIQIPNSVTNMSSTFTFCNNLNQNIQIPNSVTNMYDTFYACYNLNQNIKIPNSVTNMASTFSICNNLNQNIQIPNSVTSMASTFSRCSNLNQNIQIPNSATSMHGTFYDCNNLNQNIQIPNSVTNMSRTFYYCHNLNSWINIYSTNVTNARYCFNVNNAGCIPNVFFVFKYLNNVVTPTANAIKAAGWHYNGEGAIVGTSPNRIRTWDDGANYTDRIYNNTHCILTKWHGNMDTFLNNNVAWTTPEVPERLFLSNVPTALNISTFSRNTVITSIDLGTNIPWVKARMGWYTNSKSYGGAFNTCSNLVSVKGVINSSVNNAQIAFFHCNNLMNVDIIWPEGLIIGRAGGLCGFGDNHSPLPSTMTNILYSTTGNTQAVVIPPSMMQGANMFRSSKNMRGNIYWLSPVTSNIANAFALSNNSLRKNIYIFYTYNNGVNTTTYDKFKANNIYKGTSGNGAGLSPMYNSTSNLYVYNLSSVYNSRWNWQKLDSTNVILNKYIGNDLHVAVYAQYPDWNIRAIDMNCFNGCGNIKTLALYNKYIASPDGLSAVGIFRNCYNLRVVQGFSSIGYSKADPTNTAHFLIEELSYAYANCYNLRVASPIMQSVINAPYIFANCYNLNFNVQFEFDTRTLLTNLRGAFYGCNRLDKNIGIPYNVVDASEMFYGCTALNKNIQIPNKVQNIRSMFYGCANLSGRINVLSSDVVDATSCFQGSSKFKEVHIPYYNNGVPSKTFNSFVSAGYLYNNGVSTGRNNTVFYDLVL